MRVRRACLLGLAGAVLLALAGGAGAAPRAASAFVVGNDAPAWSPDGRKIAFTTFRHGNGEIYTMDTDGRDLVRLTRNPAHDDHAAWSPDGRRIVFASTRDGNYEIYVMNADGSQQTRLTNDPGNDYSPTWSPDGEKIAWRTDRDGNGEIYVMNADGSDPQRLTFNTSGDQSPDWSATGRIAFVSSRAGGVYNIWSMSGDGSDVRRITSGPTNKDQPDWSPDGTRLVFVSERDLPLGNTEIYVVNVDGSGERRLTEFDGRDDWPAWSPDGAQLLFTRGRTYRSPEIYLANTDGGDLKKLTSTPLRLEIVDAVARPPVAGTRWQVWLVVEDARGERLQNPAALCRASIGATRLRPAARAIAFDVAYCAWNLPKSSRGKAVRGSIGVRVGRAKVAVPFSLRIR